MKKINLFAIIGIALLAFTACDSEPSGPIPESFPKKHLIEEFSLLSVWIYSRFIAFVHQYTPLCVVYIIMLRVCQVELTATKISKLKGESQCLNG